MLFSKVHSNIIVAIIDTFEFNNIYNIDDILDIDRFVKMDFIPTTYRWGMWSLFGNKPKGDEPLYPVCYNSKSYKKFTVLKNSFGLNLKVKSLNVTLDIFDGDDCVCWPKLL